jgi:hypothetical protein
MGNAPFAGQAIRIERLLIHHDERSTATSIARRGGNAPAGVIEQAKVLQFDLLNIDLNQIKVVSGPGLDRHLQNKHIQRRTFLSKRNLESKLSLRVYPP